MKSNFEFLNSHFPVLANFGELAEKYLYSDSNSCLMKLGMIGETIVNLCFTYDLLDGPGGPGLQYFGGHRAVLRFSPWTALFRLRGSYKPTKMGEALDFWAFLS